MTPTRAAWSRVAATIFLLALGGATGAGGCSVEEEVAACERVRRLSCGCFPSCVPHSVEVIDSKESERCGEWLRGAYAEWRDRCGPASDSGSARCGAECSYGWGECAFVLYREMGLSPEGACSSWPDGGRGD